MSRIPEDRARAAPYREVEERFPEIPESSFRRSVKLVLPDGRVLEAAAGVFRLLEIGGRGWPWRLYRRLPPVRWTAEGVYRLVARNRPLFGTLTRWLWGDDPTPSSFAAGGWAFRVVLGVVYVVAFASLGVQVAGLVGPEGILPAGAYLDAVARSTGSAAEAAWRAPTLAWLASGDLALQGMAAAGAAAGLLLALGVRPLLSAAVSWILYLSLTVAGQAFLAYQWDSLLLETGFLALFLLPAGPPRGDPDEDPGPLGRLRGSLWRAPRPGWTAVWLGAWLLLRLVLESGLAKVAGGDPVWRNLTALAHHFETQPIPNPLAWFVHQLPAWAHRVGTAGALLVELPVPLLLLLPRRPRHLGALLVIALQVLILLTGNYAFFNVLAIGLALLVLDDRWWESVAGRLTELLGTGPTTRGRLRGALLVPYAALAVGVGGAQLARTASSGTLPEPVAAVAGAVSPLRLVNGYGLFADMTTRRPEIVVEGRRDGGPWRAYDFRYKPDDRGERPPQVAPHQPRLDWQMWFGALRAARVPDGAPARARYDRWFLGFVAALLRGSPDVTGLLSEESPFRGRAPDAVRARLSEYRFTGWQAWSESGDWWRREPPEPYLPPVRLGEDGLVRAR